MATIPYQQKLDELKAQLDEAVARCNRYARPAHAVRNCPSDLERSDEAWRDRQRYEYQINQLTKGAKA